MTFSSRKHPPVLHLMKTLSQMSPGKLPLVHKQVNTNIALRLTGRTGRTACTLEITSMTTTCADFLYNASFLSLHISAGKHLHVGTRLRFRAARDFKRTWKETNAAQLRCSRYDKYIRRVGFPVTGILCTKEVNSKGMQIRLHSYH